LLRWIEITNEATVDRQLSQIVLGRHVAAAIPTLVADTNHGNLVRDRVTVGGTFVREGRGLSRSLEDEKIFPDLAIEMIEVGESTGALPAMLTSVAEFYEEDVQTALGAAMALIEPLILIVMAIFVGGVLIALYLPIFSLGAGGIH